MVTIRTRSATLLLLVLAVSLASRPASAHGGSYRGWPPPPIVPPAGPTTGGPPGPNTPAATTTPNTRPYGNDVTSWQIWWEFNKEQWLRRRSEAHGPISGSDEFYLGARRSEAMPDLLAPTEADRTERIVPVLARLLRTEHNKDIATACLVALGKIGRDGVGIDVHELYTQSVPSDNNEVRETAVLAIGIDGRTQGLQFLLDAVANAPAANKVAGKERLDERMRTFAAYGLGFLAHRTGDSEVKQRVQQALLRELGRNENNGKDLPVALINALSLLNPRPESAADRRLAWQTVEALEAYLCRDLGSSMQIVQAHAPIAIARLLGRGQEAALQQAKKNWSAILAHRPARHTNIRQSAALALGATCLPPAAGGEDLLASEALLRSQEDESDVMTRYFGLIAMGRIGGPQHREALLDIYKKGGKFTEKPWAALALGVLAQADGATAANEALARLLLDDLARIKPGETRAALAIAIGLCGFAGAVPQLCAVLHDEERDEALAGYVCNALALLGDRSVVPQIQEVLARSVRRPFLLQQSALALGRLGDRQVTTALLKLMADQDSAVVLASLSGALSVVADRRSIDPLIALLERTDVTKMARAFAAAALGGIGDERDLPWNVPLSTNCNYEAYVDTLVNGRTGVLDIL